MKLPEEGDFLRAWGGIASLSVALPAVWTEASRRGFSLSDVAQWMAQKPAELAGLGSRKGRIAPGYDADLVIFEPAASGNVGPLDLHFRHPVSPYLGERLTGEVKKTFVRGICVFDEGNFLASCPGRECTVGEWTTAS
jgi:allantoinase